MAKCGSIIVGLFGLVLLMQRGDAATFTVGGSKGWSVPSDNSAVFNQWAEKMRFQIGDSLLFVYQTSDSVLQVTKEDFSNCNTNSPIAKFTDGHTEFKFNASGPYYFISGNKDNCNKNEKLVVVVLADRTTKTASPPSPVAPTPSPVVDQQQSNTTVVSPAPSAEADQPRNGATSIVLSFGSVGALVGATLLLAF
ncbi:early nodulin-like protein 9 [Silene latifolia]|uniref:early nodulin-like protein 9 n=1 Tax=Silene latifolia TaxID=37657 RepID=UPI003D78B09B